MRQVPGYALWLGHAGDIRNVSGLLAAGIVAVIDLAVHEPPAPVTRELVYGRFPLVDGPGNPPWLLRAAVAMVAGLVRDDVPTLVGCGAGLSRSPCIAGAAIARVRGCPADEGLAIALASAPADVSPALWADVCKVIE
jgi:protein-tyrosine phosphatase